MAYYRAIISSNPPESSSNPPESSSNPPESSSNPPGFSSNHLSLLFSPTDLPNQPHFAKNHTVPTSESVHESSMTISSDKEEDPNVWISRLDLHLRDKEILQSTTWLYDGILYAAILQE